jgi:hypothetical protein
LSILLSIYLPIFGRTRWIIWTGRPRGLMERISSEPTGHSLPHSQGGDTGSNPVGTANSSSCANYLWSTSRPAR